MGFTWKGEYSDRYGIIAGPPRRSILPPVTNVLAEVSRRPGALLQRSKLGVREIEIDIRFRETDPIYLEEKIREVAAWLYSEKPETLMIDPLYYYYAKLDGATEFERIMTTKGKATLTFICPDPFGYGAIDFTRFVPAGTGVTNWAIEGTYKTFPVIRATFNKPAPYFMYTTENENEAVIFGEPESDVKAAPDLPLHQVILSENFADISDWTAGSVAEDGQVLGTMAASSSGTGTATYDTFGVQPDSSRRWYGPAIKRSLPEPLEDWKVEFIVNFQNIDPKYMGRIEIYLMDVNGGIIARLSAYDRYTSTSETEIKVSLGPASDRQDLINSPGENKGAWNKFYGQIMLRKNGTNYEAFAGVYDTAKKQYHSRYTRRFYDTGNKFSTKALAQVQLHVGAFGAAKIFPKNQIYADNLIVYKRNNPEPETQVPNIVAAGDVLEFDHSTKQIYLNGVPFKRHLNPISNMFALQPGNNSIGFEPAEIADVEISYRSRWL